MQKRRSQSNLFELPPGADPPARLNAIIEVPRGSSNKYEYDPQLGVFKLDRVLYSPMHYPGDYGYVPSTLAEDGDPLDILVLTTQPSFPGCLIEARPLGLLEMSDDHGRDVKILAAPIVDPRYREYTVLEHVPAHVQRELEHFFAIYKELEGKKVQVLGWRGRYEAEREVMASIDRRRAGT